MSWVRTTLRFIFSDTKSSRALLHQRRPFPSTGEGALLEAFLLGEADEEAVLPAGVWAPLPPELVPAEGQFPSEPAGASVGHDTTGSNNCAPTNSRS